MTSSIAISPKGWPMTSPPRNATNPAESWSPEIVTSAENHMSGDNLYYSQTSQRKFISLTWLTESNFVRQPFFKIQSWKDIRICNFAHENIKHKSSPGALPVGQCYWSGKLKTDIWQSFVIFARNIHWRLRHQFFERDCASGLHWSWIEL